MHRIVHFTSWRTCAAAAASALSMLSPPALAQAQPQPAAMAAKARPDPTDARAPVPPLQHASPLAGYRRLADQPVADWPEANQNVRRIGGWRTYLRDGAASAPSPAASAAPAHRH